MLRTHNGDAYDYRRIYVEEIIPKYVKIETGVNTVLAIMVGFEDMESIKDTAAVHFYGDVKMGNPCKINAHYVHIDCQEFDFNLLQNTLSYLKIDDNSTRGSKYKTINLKGKYIEYLILKDLITLDLLENVDCNRVKISGCKNLKTIKNIYCNYQAGIGISIEGCYKLLSFEGNNIFKKIALDASCKKLDPLSLPKTITYIAAPHHGPEWLKSNLINHFPNLDPDCYLPSESKFKATGIKPGTYIVARGGATSGRSNLFIDEITKVNPSTGYVTTKKTGRAIRPESFVIMKDVNKNKNWDYINSKGINDITGVGIEVGDEVVVYPPGATSSLKVDVITLITRTGVKCEECGLRKPKDICILRSQELCKKQNL